MTTIINASTADGLKLTSDLSGEVALQNNGTTKALVSSTGLTVTGTMAATAVTGDGSALTSLPASITLETSVATTSGTAVDYTSLPSGVKRITVMFKGVSSAGSDTSALVQLGTSGGLVTTGYLANSCYDGGVGASATTGFNMYGTGTTNLMSGTMTIAHMGSNAWVSSHAGRYATAWGIWGGGNLDLGGTLDRVRIKLISGGTFDAGSVNIMYE